MADIRITPFSPAHVVALHTRAGASAHELQRTVQASIGALRLLRDGPTTALAFAWQHTPLRLSPPPPDGPVLAVTDVSHAWEGLVFTGRDAAGFLARQIGHDLCQAPAMADSGVRGLRTLLAQTPCCAIAGNDDVAPRLLVPRSYQPWLRQRLQAAADIHVPH